MIKNKDLSAMFNKLILGVFIALLGIFVSIPSASAQTACLIDFNQFDGSAPFDADNSSGNDDGLGNGIVRTNDSVALQFILTTSNGPETNVRFSFDLDPGLELTELPVFCLGAADGAVPPSSIAGDPSTTGQSVLCNVGDFLIPTASQFTFPARVMSGNANGDVVGFSNVVATGDTVCSYSDATQQNFTVSAAPALDVYKEHLNVNGRADGPSGEPGIVYNYSLLLRTFNSGVGNELITDPVVITDDLSGVAPNARLFQGWAGAPTSACFADYNTTGYVGSWPYAYQDGQAPAGTSSNAIAPVTLSERGIYNSGEISCSDTGPGGIATITVTGADLSGDNAPTRARNNGSIAANERWLANHRVSIWYPLQDVLDAGGVLNTYNNYDMAVDSVSGQPNVDPFPANNDRSFQQLAGGSGARSINNYYRRFSNDPIAPRSYLPGDSPGDRNNGTVYENYNWYGLASINHQTRNATDNNINPSFDDALLCSAWDNTRSTLTACDSSDWLSAYPTGTNQITFDGTYALSRRLQNGSLPIGSNMSTDTPIFEYASSADFGEGMTCEDADETWYSDPNLVPGGIEAVNKVRIIADHTWAPNTSSSANSYFQLWTCFVTDGDSVLGDKVPMNSYWNAGYGTTHNTFNYGTPRVSTRGITDSNAGVYTSGSLYSEATVGGVNVRVDKEEVTDSPSVLAGNTLTYQLNWTLTLDVQVSTTSDVTVVDTLGKGLQYVVGSASVPPSNIAYNGDGTTTLTWEFNDIPVNIPQPPITYDASVLTTAEDASSVINTAVISAPTDASPEAARTDVESLVVVNPTLFGVDKEVLTPIIGRDGVVEFRLSYLNNATTPVNNIRFIDILPDVTLTDPVSVYAGSLDWVGFSDPTATITAYYSKEPAANIVLDPANASNDLATGATVWCDNFDGTGVATNGSAATNCPQNGGEVEAVYFFRASMPGKTGPDFITITLQANNISQDEAFRNKFGVAADELGATLVTEVVAAIVGVADLELEKTVDNGAVPPGTDINFTITVTNQGDDADSAVEVTDIFANALLTGSASITYVSDDSGGSYDPISGVWSAGALGIGATNNQKSLTIRATVDGNLGDTITNCAEITDMFLLEKDSDTEADINTDDLGDGLADDDEDCSVVTLAEFDYGDAPLSYLVPIAGIDGKDEVYLGSTVPDNDSNHAGDGTVTSTNASDDDVEGGTANEEDAMPSMIYATNGSTAITVPLVNTSGADTILTGYIDFDFDGNFTDPGETATVTIPNGATSGILTFSGFTTTATPTSPLTTFSRLVHVTPGDIGEIEDDQIQVFVADVNVNKPLVDLTDNGDGTFTAEFDIEVQNRSLVDLYDLSLEDDLSGFGTLSTATTVATLPYGEYFVSAMPTIVTGTGATVTLASGFNGDSQPEIITPVSGDILTGLSDFTVSFAVTYRPDLNNPSSWNNQATFTADPVEDGTADGDISDDSDNPDDNTNIDPNSDGNPDDPTPAPPATTPRIGASKSTGTIVDNGNGTFDIPFALTVGNYGNVPLYDIQLEDILNGAINNFGTYVATPTSPGQYTISSAPVISNIVDVSVTAGNLSSATFWANTSYDGIGGTNGRFLLNEPSTGNDFLEVGESLDIAFAVRVYPDFNDLTIDYINQATATGNSINDDDSSEVSDLSDDSNTPDDDGDGDPTEPTENDPTNPMLQDQINVQPGIAKSASIVTGNGDGTFNVTFTFNVENFGNVPLYDVQVVDDMTTTFGSHVTGTPTTVGTYNVVSKTVTNGTGSNLVIDNIFDGDGEQDLFDDTLGIHLNVGATASVDVAIRFFPDPDNTTLINTATISGNNSEQGSALSGSDVSDNGTDSDPSGNNDPTGTLPGTDPVCIANENDPRCEDDPTPIQVPIIGTSKVVASGPTANGDGTFTATYDIFVENMGNVDLYDVQVFDNMTAGFGSAVAGTPANTGEFRIDNVIFGAVGVGSSLTINTGFNGDSDEELLTLTSGDVLATGTIANIKVTFTFFPDIDNTNQLNQAVSTGDISENGTADADTKDASDDQFPPDSDGDGTPTDDNDPTPLDIPIIGGAKIVDTPITDNLDGTFTANYYAIVENMGNVTLYDVGITDNLTAQFGTLGVAGSLNSGEYYISTAPNTAASSLVVNSGFNGDTDQELLDVPNSKLGAGDFEVVEFSVTFYPDLSRLDGGTYTNQTEVYGDTVSGAGGNPTSDTSDNGKDPDQDNNGNPEEDEPTPFTVPVNPVIGTAKELASLTDNNDGTFDAVFNLVGENLGNVTLYDINFTDDLSAGFGINVGTLANLDSAGEFVITSAPTFTSNTPDALSINSGYNGVTDANLINTSAGGSIEPTERFAITFTIRFRYDSSLVYTNQANLSGDTVEDGVSGGAGDTTSDDSDDGTDPDPDGDNDPSDLPATDPICIADPEDKQCEDDPTPIVIPINPEIGAAKQAGTVVDNGDGTFTVPFTVTLENSGNVALYDVNPQDNLTSGYGTLGTAGSLNIDEYYVSTAPSTSAPNLTANTAFNGDADRLLLVQTAGDYLEVDEIITIQFAITFRPDLNNAGTNYENQVGVTADSDSDLGGADTKDRSTDGTDPDEGGTCTLPSESDCNDPTPVTVPIDPEIGVAKAADPIITDLGNGIFQVDYTLTVENTGNVRLYDVTLYDNLTTGFGTYNPGTLSIGEYQIAVAPATTATTLTADPAFDGDVNNNMLQFVTGDYLDVGQSETVTVSVAFYPDLSPSSTLDYDNQAVATGDTQEDGVEGGAGVEVKDQSTDGLSPDENGDCPSPEHPDCSDVTPLPELPKDPVIGVAKAAGTVVDNGNGTFTVPYTITVENFGNVDLFDVQVTDNLTADFGTLGNPLSLNLGEYAVVTAPATTATSLNANTLFDGDGDENLLTLATDDTLAVNQVETITFEVIFFPNLSDVNTTYFNQAVATGDTVEDGIAGNDPDGTEDDSTDGSDPDGADSDDTPDEDTPTPLTIPANPSIGAAKEASTPVDNNDGTWDVTFTLTGENFGNLTLYDISFTDNLTVPFGTYESNVASVDQPGEYTITSAAVISSNTADPLTVNSSFNGSSVQNLIITAAGGALAVSESFAVQFTVRFKPVAGQVMENTADISGDITPDGVADGDTTDDSVDGTNPDGTDSDDNPDEDSPTPIIITETPEIGAAKAVESITDNGNGTFTVNYTVVVENSGNMPLYDVQATDDLTAGFGTLGPAGSLSDGQYAVTTAPAIISTGALSALTANAAFNGDTDQNLTAFNSGDVLEVGEQASISFSITFKPDLTNAAIDYTNQVIAFGDTIEDGAQGGTGTQVQDDSTDGLDPDEGGSCPTPTDPDCEDVTPVTIPTDPEIGVAKEAAGLPTDNGDGTFTIAFNVKVENTGNIPLYDVQLEDDITAGAGIYVATTPTVAGTYTIASAPVISSIGTNSTLVTNPLFNGSSDINLLNSLIVDKLEVGEGAVITFSITFYPDYSASSMLTYENTTQASGDTLDGVGGDSVTDDSVNGTSVDPDSDDDPTNDTSPTPYPTLPTEPSIGTAKAAGTVVDNGNGTFTIPYTVTVENFGNVDLYDVQLTDVLTADLGSYNAGTLSAGQYNITVAPATTAPNLTANTSFNGDSDINLLTLNTGDKLAYGESATITFSVLLYPDFSQPTLTYTNEVDASGDITENGTSDGDVTDDSVDGVDPDGTDSDFNPDEESPTPVTIPTNPVIGTAKSAGAITDNNDGTFDVTYTFTLENLGNVPLYDIALTDDLAAVFGSFESPLTNINGEGEYGIVSAPSVITNTVNPLTTNAGFNGSASTNLINTGAGGSIAIGETAVIEVTIRFFPDLADSPWNNQAIGSGDTIPDGNPDGDSTDNSDDGIDPDTDGNDDPTDPDNEDPTPLSALPINPEIGVAKALTNTVDNNDGTFDITYEFNIENFGNVPLYDISLTDDLAAIYGDYEVSLAGIDQISEYAIVSAPSLTSNSADALTVSSVFSGSGANTEIFDIASGGSIAVGETVTVGLTIRVYPDIANTPFNNTATASGDISTNADGIPDGDSTDDSVDGTDPDGTDSDDNPDESSPTPFAPAVDPVIGAAKDVMAIVAGTQAGTFDVTYNVIIENFGNVPLYDVQVIDDLNAGYGTEGILGSLAVGEYAVSSAPVVSFTTDVIPTGDALTTNSGYDGNIDQNLLSFNSGDSLGVNDVASITFTVTFFPDFNSTLDYSNQAIASGDTIEDGASGGAGDSTTDNSHDGVNPDPNSNDDPTDENDPTPIDPIPTNPEVGLAKDISAVTDNGDGTFTATYTITVENSGDVPLYDVQITDDLTAGFGTYIAATPSAIGTYTVSVAPSTTAPNLTTNAAFNGSVDQNLLTLNTGDNLAVSEVSTVTFEITFFPNLADTNLDYSNQAIIVGDVIEDGTSGNDPDGVTDNSTDGVDPDEGGSCPTPTDPNCNDSTPIGPIPTNPQVGVAKQAVTPITDNGNGTFDVTYNFVIENLGNIPLYDVSLTDDLAAVFGGYESMLANIDAAGEYGIVSAPSIITNSADALSTNSGFDGASDIELLDISAGGSIAVGESINLNVIVRMFPDLVNGTPWNNQAVGSGDSEPDGNSDGDTTDNSDNGTDPDIDGNEDPTDPENEDPTPLPTIPVDPEIGVAKSLDNLTDNNDGTFTAKFTATIENFGNVPLFDVQATDDLTAGFGALGTAGSLAVGEYAVTTAPSVDIATLTTNAAFDGSADINLLTFTSSDSLAVGGVTKITFAVTFKPDFNSALDYSNEITAYGDTIEDGGIGGAGDPTEDDSVNGTNPDPDSNDDPEEESETPITVPTDPEIGIAKAAIPTLTDNNDGTFTVDYTLIVENSGNVPLYDTQVTDDVSAGFGTYNSGALAIGEYKIAASPALTVPATSLLTINSAFDGNTTGDINLLAFTAGDVLEVGDVATITFSVIFYPDLSGSTTFENQATATGESVEDGSIGGAGDPAEDDSQDGSNVDPDSNDDPTDNDDPTPLPEIPTDPAIGIAKSLTSLTDNNDGTFTAEFLLTADNMGNIDLFDVQVTDDLTTGFGTLGTIGSLNDGEYAIAAAPSTGVSGVGSAVAANAVFDGSSDINLLTLNAADTIVVGGSATISFSIRFKPDLNNAAITYQNVAIGSGDETSDGTPDGDTTDDSTDGADPDPDDNDDPSDNDEPTDVTPPLDPQIGAAKDVTVVDNNDGTFDLTFSFVVENMGNIELFDIALDDSLTAEFGSYQTSITNVNVPFEYGILTAPSVSVNSATPITANAGFNGDTDTNLIDTAAGGSLEVGESITLEVVVRVYPDFTTAPFVNQAIASGDTTQNGSPDGDTTDNSTDGTDPDPTNNDDPTDDEDPTPIPEILPMPKIGIAKQATVIGRDITFVFTIENSGNAPLDNISILDNFDNVFGAGNYTFNSITSSTGGLHNAAFDGSTDVELANNTVTLLPTDIETITVNITLDTLSDQGNGFAVYENQVTATAEDPIDTPVEDDSTDGTDPDSDGNDDPTDNNEVTPIEVGNLDLQKRLIDVNATPTENQYEATFEFTLVNNGSATVSDLQLIDDFGGQNPAVISIISSNGTIVPSDSGQFSATTYNTAFATNATDSVFSSGTAELDASESVVVTAVIVFEIDPVLEESLGISNVATAQGVDPNGGDISDESDSDGDETNGGNTPLILPIDPSGIIYDSQTGEPVEGATVEMLDISGNPFPASCFVGGQQPQVTGEDGAYRFDIIVGANPACPASETDYTIAITPAAGHLPPVSGVIPPTLPTGSGFDASTCTLAASGMCEIGSGASSSGIDLTSASTNTTYYFTFSIEAGDADVTQNNIPLDPASADTLVVTKVANTTTASVGDFIQWTIEVINPQTFNVATGSIIDTLPLGISYVTGSTRIDNVAVVDPIMVGNQVLFSAPSVPAGGKIVITMLTRVGSNAAQGAATNIVRAEDGSGNPLSNTGEATVEITPDPVFDCTPIIGHVFYDTDKDGYYDDGERGVPNARLARVTGEVVTTDSEGRYHIECAITPQDIGSNFILKLDNNSVDKDAVLTSENPRVVRATKGKMAKLNFGIAKPREVTLDINDDIFDECTWEISDKFRDDFKQLIKLVKEEDKASLRIIYRTFIKQTGGIPKERLNKIINRIRNEWREADYREDRLTIREEIIYDSSIKPTFGCKPKERQFIIYFDHDKDNLDAQALAVIAGLESYLKSNPSLNASLSGHADTSGNKAYNIGLSKRRVDRVKDKLSRLRLARRIEKTNYEGEFRNYLNLGDETRERFNRRVEIIVK